VDSRFWGGLKVLKKVGNARCGMLDAGCWMLEAGCLRLKA